MRSETVVKSKVSITINEEFVKWIDSLIEKGLFRNRSHAIEEFLRFAKKEGIEKIFLEKLKK
ncbi:MAG: ribbon-helix-helix domain-containing protein [Candidatus Bathyarchaeia archaeon]